MGSDMLVRHLFDDCRLLDWLVNVQTEVTATPCNGDQRQASKCLLMESRERALAQLRCFNDSSFKAEKAHVAKVGNTLQLIETMLCKLCHV